MEDALFIAPDGSDANTGTMEKSFATLERARDKIREKKLTKIRELTRQEVKSHYLECLLSYVRFLDRSL